MKTLLIKWARSILSEEIKLDKETISYLNDTIDKLNKQVKKQEPNLLEAELNNKYPAAKVAYNGRNFGTSKTIIPIDVRLLVTPNDFHILEIIEKNKLQIVNPETDIPKIYKFIKNNYYKYVEDQANYGIGEFWEFPFEILEKKKLSSDSGFDCDSWANLQASFYIAAGMPNYKVRVTVGNCDLGRHSTVYVYSEKDQDWHHLNSTYGRVYDTLIEYPKHDDQTDRLTIKSVWFSFNNLYAWNEFTGTAAREFKRDDRFIIKNDTRCRT